MMSTAIKFENISKEYRLGLVSTQTLSHDLNRWWKMNIQGKEDPYLKIGEVNDRATKGKSDYVWALKDINFEVQQGDVLGIIGKNGAGKSTLLKILSKVTAPTTGTIKARGRIASLLEVGTGFHPEMTGRENIFMNGAIMGMSKAEIKSKLDEIVDFSGVERYLDTPVKRYSSGMTVRLGFAIAAHLEPEILVVDEVLAVGDAEFQKKAIGKMQDVSRGEGRTVLFVSHNMDSVQKLCTKGLILKNGEIEYNGTIDKAIQLYQNIYFVNQQTVWSAQFEDLISQFQVTKFMLEKDGDILLGNVKDNDEIYVVIEFISKVIENNITIGISLFDEKGQYVYRSLHTDKNPLIYKQQQKGKNRLRARIETDFLKSGIYRVVLDVSYHNLSWIVNPFEEYTRVLTFTKEPNLELSAMQSSTAVINPSINWEFA
ncbi:MAG: ABC transporter ATP-binding protein [Paludibacter sp.]|nr:ABC transporter ATP-binding protein [Paludibacter sp.]